MILLKAATRILRQLADLVDQIQSPDYTRSSDILSGSTIGQHIRHTLEFFICFQRGLHGGIINYDKRLHDQVLESDKDVALTAIHDSLTFLSTVSENRHLILEAGYGAGKEGRVVVDTNTMRELVYNIEHAVHHMAIIRIGLREIAPYVKLSTDFGVAVSTIHFNPPETALSTITNPDPVK